MAGQVKYYAKSIQTQERRGLGTVPSSQLFCTVAWHEGPGHARFDLTATDGSQSWQIKDAGPPPAEDHVLSADEYMAACKAALCAAQPTEAFDYIVNRSSARMRLDVRWRAPSLDGVATIQLDLALVPAENTGATMAGVLSMLCNGYASLNASVEQLGTINRQLSQQLSDTQSQLLRQKEESSQREEDLYIKFSLLLNSKKGKLRELEAAVATRDRQLAELQEQVKRGAIQESDSDTASGGRNDEDIAELNQQEDNAGHQGVDARGELGQAGPSPQGRGQTQGLQGPAGGAQPEVEPGDMEVENAEMVEAAGSGLRTSQPAVRLPSVRTGLGAGGQGSLEASGRAGPQAMDVETTAAAAAAAVAGGMGLAAAAAPPGAQASQGPAVPLEASSHWQDYEAETLPEEPGIGIHVGQTQPWDPAVLIPFQQPARPQQQQPVLLDQPRPPAPPAAAAESDEEELDLGL